MQPQGENTFTQIPWFATTQTGSIDLYASAVSRYSSNLNESNNSNSNNSQTKNTSEKKSKTKARNDLKKGNTDNSEVLPSRRQSKKVTGSTTSLSAWSGIPEGDDKVGQNIKEVNSSEKSLRTKRDSLTTSINNSKTSLRKLLSNKETEKVDRQTFIEPLDPIMSYSSQVEPSTNMRRPGLDANRYATKKTIAQGMLDVALLTANASQLKYVLQLGPDKHPFYELMLSLIVISIILQVVAGVLFLVIGGLSINEGSTNQKTADILNDVIVVVIFIITLINVVISGFGIRATDEGQIKL